MKKLLVGLVCVVLCLSGCSATPYEQKQTAALDTVIQITLYGTEDTTLIDTCFDKVRAWETQLSRTAPTGDVYRLNHAGGQPVSVSEFTAKLLDVALHYSTLTQGAFDITVAPLTDCWDFKSEQPTLPSEQEIRDALPFVGYEGVRVSGTQVQLSSPQSSVDLGGIAKGYIADELVKYLTAEGTTEALIDLGGNIYALGARNGRDWRVGIRDPQDETALKAVVYVQNQSVVTSGTYERGFDYGGTRYHHILDPKTGYPVQNGLTSVTVVSDYSVDGDALATACLVMGLEKGKALIESLPDIEAMFITDDGTCVATNGLRYEIQK